MSAIRNSSAPSAPLYELAEAAPLQPADMYNPSAVDYPFANDEPATQFNVALARTESREYCEATNRVAIVIGESFLAANLAAGLIPEETIIVLDSSPDMCSFMGRYVEGLRDLGTPTEWQKFMGFDGVKFMDPALTNKFINEWLQQVGAWEIVTRDRHALDFVAQFRAAQANTHGKAIIPWCTDITDPDNMKELGDALKTLGATVTMINLTNVVPYARYSNSTAAPVLEDLPLMPNTPILTTSMTPKLIKTGCFDNGVRVVVNQPAGIFEGLDDFKQNGGNEGRAKEPESDDPDSFDNRVARLAWRGIKVVTYNYQNRNN